MRFLPLAVSAVLLGFAAAPSYASVTSAAVWLNDFSNDASVIPAGPPSSTFNAGLLNYDSNATGYTVGQFVNDPTGSGFSNPSVAAAGLDNTHFEFKGTIGLLAGNNSFVVGHDDGLILSITGFGLVLNQPGPTAFTNTPFNVFNPGAAGNFAFQLDYNECCGPPAELEFAVNNVNVGSVPELGTWAMMIIGFAGVGLQMRRRQSSLALTA
jgi:hypothetical protein